MSERKNKKEIEFNFKSLRFQLTLGFVLFSLILMGLLWLFQSVSLHKVYENAMDKKAKKALDSISELFAEEENLDMKRFSVHIESVSHEDDVFIYMEDIDGKHGMKSSDFVKVGRSFADAAEIIRIAHGNLEAAGGEEISLIYDLSSDTKVAIRAVRVDSEYRQSVNLYALAAVTPIGPTVEILRHLTFFITMIAIILGAIIAAFIARSFSKPISLINDKTKLLAKGNYNVTFDTKSNITEINELSDTLNYTAEELGRADALQKDLLANVSHDLRTPLTMVKSYAEMIRDLSGDIPEKREEHLGVIIEEADRLSDLVGDILLISKIQSGTLELEHKAFDLQHAAEAVLQAFMVMEQEGFKFRFVKMPVAVQIVGDESKMQQVISNLVSNAIRYSRSVGPEIILSFNKVGEHKVRVSVADNGQGIPEDQIEGIWNRYQRASKSAGRALSGGTGLGLSIVREILEHHGATYGVNSKQGEGSTFWFEIDCDYM